MRISKKYYFNMLTCLFMSTGCVTGLTNDNLKNLITVEKNANTSSDNQAATPSTSPQPLNDEQENIIDKMTPPQASPVIESKPQKVTFFIQKSVFDNQIANFADTFNVQVVKEIEVNSEDGPCVYGTDQKGTFIQCEKGKFAGEAQYLSPENFPFKRDALQDTITITTKSIFVGDKYTLKISGGNHLCSRFGEAEITQKAEVDQITISHDNFSKQTLPLDDTADYYAPFLHGQITDPNGNPIQNVVITATVSAPGVEPPTAISKADGIYILYGLRPNETIELSIEKQGSEKKHRTVTLKEAPHFEEYCNPDLNRLDIQLN